MGEIANAMLEGLFCEECGQLIDGEQPGYPRKCDDCKPRKQNKHAAVHGVKNFLTKRRGLTSEQAESVILQYGTTINISGDIRKTCKEIQKVWQTFVNWYDKQAKQ